MDPLTAIGTAAKIGSAILGGIGMFKKRREPPAVNLGEVRRQAELHGFNPLTVLRATGGLGFNQGARMQPLTAFSDTFAATADAVFGFQEMRQREELHDAQLSILAKELKTPEQRPARRFPSVPAVLPAVPGKSKPGPGDPGRWAGMAWNDIPMVQLWTPAGRAFSVKENLADRLGMSAGDVFMSEDAEALWGEVGGEVTGVGFTGDFYHNQWFGDQDPAIQDMPEELWPGADTSLEEAPALPKSADPFKGDTPEMPDLPEMPKFDSPPKFGGRPMPNFTWQ